MYNCLTILPHGRIPELSKPPNVKVLQRKLECKIGISSVISFFFLLSFFFCEASLFYVIYDLSLFFPILGKGSPCHHP